MKTKPSINSSVVTIQQKVQATAGGVCKMTRGPVFHHVSGQDSDQQKIINVELVVLVRISSVFNNI